MNDSNTFNNCINVINSLFIFFLAVIFTGNVKAKEIHVSITGDDLNSGSEHRPLRTINKAASLIQPGDMVTVHAGTYREWVKPSRGGASVVQPVIFRAADGENVIIKGSERITKWRKLPSGLWKIDLSDSCFGDYNPFALKINGPWLTYGINQYHRGGVFLNEVPLLELLSLDSVRINANTWHTENQNGITSICANFGNADPNIELTEITVRECVFFPEITGVNFVTVDGFHLMHSSENWAPPHSHQKGAIGTNWGYGWVIQNCKISDAKCLGICIGHVPGFVNKNIDVDKFKDDLAPNVDHIKDRPEYKQNKEAFEAEYNKRIQSMLKSLREQEPVNMNEMGHHIIRNNTILRCGQSGIAGDGGGKFSLIEGNLIEETNYTRQFGGWETAGIKLHAAVDVVIRNNCIRGVYGIPGEAAFGIWLDWEAQGTRISGNVICETENHALYFEVSHGPILLDNNVIIGGGVRQLSEGGVFVHNLFYGGEYSYSHFVGENRVTPYYRPHSVDVAGYDGMVMRDDKWYNNIFIGNGLQEIVQSAGFESDYNIFLDGAEKSTYDVHSLITDFDPGFEYCITQNIEISFGLDSTIMGFECPLITHDLIGKVTLPGEGIEHHDGSPITVDFDYFTEPRDRQGRVTPGPFVQMKEGNNKIVLWPNSFSPTHCKGR